MLVAVVDSLTEVDPDVNETLGALPLETVTALVPLPWPPSSSFAVTVTVRAPVADQVQSKVPPVAVVLWFDAVPLVPQSIVRSPVGNVSADPGSVIEYV